MNKYGKKRQKTQEPVYHDPHQGKCEWTRAGHRCQMPGAINEMGKWFCGWHKRCLSNPRLISDLKEFESFLKTRISPMDAKMIEKNIPPPINPWRDNTTTLWRKVGQ